MRFKKEEITMDYFYDFAKSALPWIAIGLMVAAILTNQQAKREGKEPGKFLSYASRGAIACFLFVAFMEFTSGNFARGFTWLILGFANLVLNV